MAVKIMMTMKSKTAAARAITDVAFDLVVNVIDDGVHVLGATTIGLGEPNKPTTLVYSLNEAMKEVIMM
jgi:hypothetical protein